MKLVKTPSSWVGELGGLEPEYQINLTPKEVYALHQARRILERASEAYCQAWPGTEPGDDPYFRASVEIQECLNS